MEHISNPPEAFEERAFTYDQVQEAARYFHECALSSHPDLRMSVGVGTNGGGHEVTIRLEDASNLEVITELASVYIPDFPTDIQVVDEIIAQ